MKKYLIFGNNYFAEMMMHYVEKYDKVEVIAFTVDKQYIDSDYIYGRPFVPFEDIEKQFDPTEYQILLCLGYKEMSILRKNKYEECKRKGYHIASFIHPNAHLEKVKLGEGNLILENVSIGYDVVIGNGNIFWNGVNISHHCNIHNYNFFAPSCVLAGKVTVHNNCFFGINATCKGGINILSFTLVGANCYLKNNTKDYEVYVPEKSKKLENKNSLDLI